MAKKQPKKTKENQRKPKKTKENKIRMGKAARVIWDDAMSIADNSWHFWDELPTVIEPEPMTSYGVIHDESDVAILLISHMGKDQFSDWHIIPKVNIREITYL